MIRNAMMALSAGSLVLASFCTCSPAVAGDAPLPAGRPAAAMTGTATTAIPVQLVKREGRWQLLRGGQPFYVRGAGGDGPAALLAEVGGNCNRTWGADDIQGRLDAAHRNGLAIAVGLWLGHERHGFKYDDPAMVAAQFEKIKQQVLRYKDHPAVLVWGVGNEMEGFGAGDNPKIWAAVEQIAAFIKQVDPNHPVMTTVAEVGGKRVQSIHAYCPSVDIVGLNTYAGASSIPKRYRQNGGTKPFLITEYGPPGTWEVGRNKFGKADEATSTAKAEMYKRSYEAFVAENELCLGSFAFTWGSKVEATSSWFGMLLPGGEKLEVVDYLAGQWGHPVANRCPQIKPITFEGGNLPTVHPGQTLIATVEVEDPEHDSLTTQWVLSAELEKYTTGGDRVAAPPNYAAAIVRSETGRCELRAPEATGFYRLYAVVRDGKGGAALANAMFKVENAKAPSNRQDEPGRKK